MRWPSGDGFTLIELLVVIAVIGILSSIGLVSINGAREKARDAKRFSDLAQLRTALAIYASNHENDPAGLYPIVSPAVKISDSTSAVCQALVPTYIAGIPKTPLSGVDENSDYWYIPSDVDIGRFALFTKLERGNRWYVINTHGSFLVTETVHLASPPPMTSADAVCDLVETNTSGSDRLSACLDTPAQLRFSCTSTPCKIDV